MEEQHVGGHKEGNKTDTMPVPVAMLDTAAALFAPISLLPIGKGRTTVTVAVAMLSSRTLVSRQLRKMQNLS